jgi:hypothetical protein
MMIRPRDSHDLRLLNTRLMISPQPVAVRWLHDLFGNSVAIASFQTTATELHIVSEIDLDHYERNEPDCAIEAYAATYPFAYAVDEAPDLLSVIQRHYPDPIMRSQVGQNVFSSPQGPPKRSRCSPTSRKR